MTKLQPEQLVILVVQGLSTNAILIVYQLKDAADYAAAFSGECANASSNYL